MGDEHDRETLFPRLYNLVEQPGERPSNTTEKPGKLKSKLVFEFFVLICW